MFRTRRVGIRRNVAIGLWPYGRHFGDMCDCIEGDYEELAIEVEEEPQELVVPITVKKFKK